MYKVCNPPVATGRVNGILCCLPWLLIKIEIIHQIAYFSFTNKKLQTSQPTLASEVPKESSCLGKVEIIFFSPCNQQVVS